MMTNEFEILKLSIKIYLEFAFCHLEFIRWVVSISWRKN